MLPSPSPQPLLICASDTCPAGRPRTGPALTAMQKHRAVLVLRFQFCAACRSRPPARAEPLADWSGISCVERVAMPLPHEEDEQSPGPLTSTVLPDPREVTGRANDAAELVDGALPHPWCPLSPSPKLQRRAQALTDRLVRIVVNSAQSGHHRAAGLAGGARPRRCSGGRSSGPWCQPGLGSIRPSAQPDAARGRVDERVGARHARLHGAAARPRRSA
eukprot:scaffold6532_cov116-Isochrysis_galbana.AAC.10